jgi:hypothetical protein
MIFLIWQILWAWWKLQKCRKYHFLWCNLSFSPNLIQHDTLHHIQRSYGKYIEGTGYRVSRIFQQVKINFLSILSHWTVLVTNKILFDFWLLLLFLFCPKLAESEKQLTSYLYFKKYFVISPFSPIHSAEFRKIYFSQFKIFFFRGKLKTGKQQERSNQ